jgi:hypothetical protein
MQKLANKVGSVIVKYNRDNMKEIRETIVEENEMCDLEQRSLLHNTICDIDQQNHTFYILTSLYPSKSPLFGCNGVKL